MQITHQKTIFRMLFFRSLLCYATAMVTFSAALAQPEAASQPTSAPAKIPEPEDNDLTPESLALCLKQLESDTELPAEVKTQLISLYRQALDQVNLAADWSAKAAGHKKLQEEAPAQLEALRNRKAQAATRPAEQPLAGLSPGATLDDLTFLLTKAQANLTAKQEALKILDDEIKKRSERRAAIPDLLAEANKRMQAVTAAPESPSPKGQPAKVTAARQIYQFAQQRAIGQEIKAYEEELQRYAVRNDLALALQEEATGEVTEAQALVAALQNAVSERRQAEAELQKRQMETELRLASPALREVAEENAALAEERANLTRLLDSAIARTETTRSKNEQWAKELDNLQQAVTDVGASDFVGGRMMRLRTEIDTSSDYDRDLRVLKREAARIGLRRVQIEEQQDSLAKLDAQARLAAQELEPAKGINKAEIESRLTALLNTRRELFQNLLKDYESYTGSMIQLQLQTRRLMDTMTTLRAYIAERAFWLPNTTLLTTVRWPKDLSTILPPLGELGHMVHEDIRQNAALYLVAVALEVVLFFTLIRIARRLRIIATRVNTVRADTFGLTLQALGATVLFLAPITFFLWFVRWRVLAAGETGGVDAFAMANAIHQAMWFSILQWLGYGFLYYLCRPAGLGDAHFHWNSDSLRLVRRYTMWLVVVIIPTTFLAVATIPYSSLWRDSFGRLSFTLLMLAQAFFLERVFHPSRGVLASWLQAHRYRGFYRWRYVCFALLVATPVILSVLSVLGYHFTALALAARLILRMHWLVLGLLVLHALLVRWLTVAQKRVAANQARKKLAAQFEARRAGLPEEDPTPDEEGAPELELVQMSDQTRKLLRAMVVFGFLVGMWFIWGDMLPAMKYVGDVPLWSYTAEAVTGGTAGTTVTQIRYITLADLALALVVSVATIALARNLPGLIEILLLERLPLDRGGRFAVTTMVRYLIFVVGAGFAFGAVGIGWSKVQWLAAGVTVGLGFGLQEIFANLISGLMLLLERPIRIGDVVTVGDVSGTITRIQIRATTITDWDRKELVIPNKAFITGQIINWTLSDSTLRVVVPIGIAYGSNVDLVKKTLLDVARQTPLVLPDPMPAALFMGFGDSSLTFELRVFVAEVCHMMDVRDQLNQGIDREFRRAGIEIPFPQRDLHIRTGQQSLPIAPIDAQRPANRQSE